ncbi:hypothetical protein PHLCEN_2v5213 [Hermanssonia centrifuga]|uniref:Reverse transcriptase Ty1/copia-type domain-containing protein n=1 Tax=Hermanssonia centrifuga TaxID=98765 RepID=A0A2R6P8S3_9APHY|nr:hypothetical protein PHLCEN_2v5213 [Hermanssonia centrifuga]
MCAIAAIEDDELVQTDIKSAFLYGCMEPGEDVYLVPPKGITLPGLKPRQVLKLRACLYGLKQAGRQWYQKLRDALRQIGFTRSQFDHAVFYQRLSPAEGSGTATIFCHVDDMGLKANKKYMPHLIAALRSRFKLSKGGQIHYLLGMHIEKRTISFSQSAYINRILTRYRFDEIRTVTTPMDPNVALSKEQCTTSERQQEEMKNKPYREALGTLMYASVGTRPDITYAVSTLAKFSQNPGPTHWTALKRVFAYLCGTQHYTLTLGGNSSPILTGYCDSDGMSHPDRHPIAAYVFTIGGAISWSSKRQDIVCLSTTEAEYIALTHAAKEAIWLHHLLDEVFPKRFKLPITVYSDNQGAIALSKDDRFHTRTKHIDIRFHFVRQYVEDGTLSITYLPTDRMLADALTKALAGPQLTKLAGAIGLQTYKYQANCAFLVDMPARPTRRYQQSTQSS